PLGGFPILVPFVSFPCFALLVRCSASIFSLGASLLVRQSYSGCPIARLVPYFKQRTFPLLKSVLHSVNHFGHASQSIHYPRNHPYRWGRRLLYLVAIEMDSKTTGI